MRQTNLQEAPMGGGARYGLQAPVIGTLRGTTPTGDVLVAWGGSGPVAARPVARLDPTELARPENMGREVLLLFPAGGPVIVDLLAYPLGEVLAETLAPDAAGPAPEARVDGRRVVLEGRDEVVLRCGEASITLRRDGKLVIRGSHVLSRATARHRIKGASVAIN